jgi:hypothetical protein
MLASLPNKSQIKTKHVFSLGGVLTTLKPYRSQVENLNHIIIMAKN